MFAVPENTIALPQSHAAPHPVRIALDVAARRERWAHLLRYDPDTRFAALVERTDEQEVWLMSWLPGQHTDLHDHGPTTGAFTVVGGSLTEVVASRGHQVLHNLVAGQSRVFGPDYAHQVRNDGVDPAVTIHVYRDGGRTVRPVRFDPVG
ncbi:MULTISPECIES: cysteine dioxygenase [Saccharothrix]|uniref:Cysteine dioxygenase n=2 Tax=Saccharothrix TaxID=2071 RepID=A0ABU0X2L0_9PSEU|nr:MULTISPECIES: cysteine dioxygenase family protein [Saccharothrix]MBY8847813.1 cysteine dioxygenase family protein [Saccharothrix sp. MB29]MDQ2586212.1 cysteine dioxygenase [Saccharothrix yanglingensis]MDR6596191.1 putative metal-dependent enzyme (double-stranded beta helix superfamily) [Saccharothrix longispora]MDU0293782.1 cysteine dioxygenase family protein [Saccharothrix longispora]